MADTPQLPSWTDPQAITSYLVTLAGTAEAVVVAIHPGFTPPAAVQAVLPAIGMLVAGAVTAVNIITHRAAHTAAGTGTTSRAQTPPPTGSPAELLTRAQTALDAAAGAITAARQAAGS